MLVQATKVLTTYLSADEHALCKQGKMPDELGKKANDAVLKAMEGKDNGNRQFGLIGKNAEIVASVVGQLPYHAQEQGNSEMASQLIKANSRVVALEQELKATTEQSKIATKAKPYVAAGCVDNPGRGICAYYVVAAILQILDGIHLNNVSYAPTAIQKAKESVLSNALQFQRSSGRMPWI